MRATRNLKALLDLEPGHVTNLWVMSATRVTPASRITFASSARKCSSTAATLSAPHNARPQSAGRPTPTASAPSANALNTSVPRLIPLSNRTLVRPATLATIGGRAAMAPSPVSSCLPPWLETMIPGTLRLAASSPSSGEGIPLTRTGREVCFRVHS